MKTEAPRVLTIAELGGNTFETTADGYTWRFPGTELALEANWLRWERGELFGQLSILLQLAGVHTVDGQAEVSTMNFSSLSARATRAKLLASLTKTSDFPWGDLLQGFALRVLKRQREGEASIDLRDVSIDPQMSTVENVLGIPIPRFDPIMLVAKGGDCKSLIVLYVLGELSRRGYRCGFVDSEWNEFEHRERLGRLFPNELPSIQYRRLERPLAVELDGVRRFVHDQGLDFIAFDSVGQSVDAPLETSEAANNYMRAIRGLGRRGTILVSHVKHDGQDGQSSKRPFGSSYFLNGVRSCWFLKSAEAGPNKLESILENVKVNAGPKRSPVALSITFGDTIEIKNVQAGELQELATALPIRDRIIGLLKRRGALSKDEIADELDAKADSVKKALERGDQTFVRIDTVGGDRVVRFGLKERGVA